MRFIVLLLVSVLSITSCAPRGDGDSGEGEEGEGEGEGEGKAEGEGEGEGVINECEVDGDCDDDETCAQFCGDPGLCQLKAQLGDVCARDQEEDCSPDFAKGCTAGLECAYVFGESISAEISHCTLPCAVDDDCPGTSVCTPTCEGSHCAEPLTSGGRCREECREGGAIDFACPDGEVCGGFNFCE